MMKKKNRIGQAYEDIDFPQELKDRTLEALLAAPNRERITLNKKARTPKKTAAVIAASAAALAMTVSAGAVAYNALFHKESAERFGVAEAVYSGEGFEARAVENEHFRLTADSVMSDGIMAHAVFTLDPLDDLGRKYNEMAVTFGEGACPTVWLSEDKEGLHDRSSLHANTDGELAFELNSDGGFSFETDLYLGDTDSTLLWLCLEDRYGDMKLLYDGAVSLDHTAPSMFDGLEMQLELGRNVEVREFRHGDDILYLSQTAITITGSGAAERERAEQEREKRNFTDPEPEYCLVYENGSRKDLMVGGTSWSPRPDKGYETMFLHQTVDLNGVASVVYYGNEYLPS